ncbi:MAG: IS5 family transposase [Planctomycetes bacterium]|nr:IS5 family transposase [Planctomycetota bacterium]
MARKTYLVSDALWEKILPFIPPRENSHPRGGGRKPVDDRRVMNAIFYVLNTGSQWNALNDTGICPSSTAHDRFQKWVKAGLFHRLWEEGLLAYDEAVGIDWTWLSMDGAMTKAPLGGEKTGPNPTDRAKDGVKRSTPTDANGIPVGLAVAAANENDITLVAATMESIPVLRPLPTEEAPQHLCLDKGYDARWLRWAISFWGLTPHIRSRGEEAKRDPGVPARRWVMERTHSWLNRSRRILIHWEKRLANYTAMLHLRCAILVFGKLIAG